jgi:hypothetical protein
MDETKNDAGSAVFHVLQGGAGCRMDCIEDLKRGRGLRSIKRNNATHVEI